jgi:D-isomer specific 2-hydroxyacid dehydrogenase, NAD binding domain
MSSSLTVFISALINTPRGKAVDQSALVVEAVKRHRLAAAGIDVLDMEPPSPAEQYRVNGRWSKALVEPRTNRNITADMKSCCTSQIVLELMGTISRALSYDFGEVVQPTKEMKGNS